MNNNKFVVSALAAGMSLAMVFSQTALASLWVGGEGDWEEPNNWNPVGIPGELDDVHIDDVFTSNSIVRINSINPSINSLNIANTFSSTDVVQFDGLLNVNTFETIGSFSDTGATYTLMGGTNRASTLVVGQNGDGSYSMNGGFLETEIELIGNGGHGVFNQAGGTNTASLGLSIGGSGNGGDGRYNLIGGSVTAGLEYIDEVSIFDQTGGSNTVSDLRIDGGIYHLAGGTLEVVDSMNNDGNLALSGGALSGSGALSNNAVISGHGTIGGSGGFTNNAFISQDGGNLNLNNTGINANYGNIYLASGYQFRLNDATLSNSGTINLDSAIVTGSGALNNTFGGIITGRGTINSDFNNSGGLVVLTSGTTNIVKSFDNSGAIQLDGATASLVGGAITNTGTIQGFGSIGNIINNSGTVHANGGTLVLSSATINNQASGLMTVSNGSTMLAVNGMANNAGIINLAGGSFDNNNHPLINNGQISGYGTLRTGGLTNNSTVTLTGDLTTVNGNITNATSGRIEVAHSPAIFTGNIINNGQFKTTHTTVTFTGTYTENGVFISDPSINNFADLIIGTNGYLVGGKGDEWHITHSFVNHSLQNNLWNTADADLFFDGSGLKDLYLAGADYGFSAHGFTNNFAFGSMHLATSVELNVFDGNGTPGAAMYVGLLDLDGGVSQLSNIHSHYNIYYDPALAGNAYLLGSSYRLDGGGVLAPAVPEPETYAMLLTGLGFLCFSIRRREPSQNRDMKQQKLS